MPGTKRWYGCWSSTGAEVNVAERRMGQTPLMWAAAGGYTAITRFLIASGAEAGAISTNGFRPILFAAASGDAASAQALIAAGADPHVTAADGRSPFLIAAAEGGDAVTRLMLDHGADVNARDRDGGTALHAVVAQGKRRGWRGSWWSGVRISMPAAAAPATRPGGEPAASRRFSRLRRPATST